MVLSFFMPNFTFFTSLFGQCFKIQLLKKNHATRKPMKHFSFETFLFRIVWSHPTATLSNSTLEMTVLIFFEYFCIKMVRFVNRYLFFFDIQNPMESVKICVNKCPDRILKTPEDLQNFAKDIQSPICRYDIPLEAYSDIKEYELSLVCPNLPVYPRYVNYSVPTTT